MDKHFLKSDLGLPFNSFACSQSNSKRLACGAWKLDTPDTNEQSLKVMKIITHPEYNFMTNANDIALLKVCGRFNCEQGQIWPACLPNEEASFPTINFFLTLMNKSSEIFICWMGGYHCLWLGYYSLFWRPIQHTAVCKASSCF